MEYNNNYLEKINHLEDRVDSLEKLVVQLSNHLLHGSLEVDGDSRMKIIKIVNKVNKEQTKDFYYANDWNPIL